jgi:hypothetical protein
MSARFDALGFAPAYEVEIDPQIPANGVLECESYAYGRNGRRINDFDFDSRWGTPLLLRVKPDRGEPWVAAFAAGGLGVVRNVYACPSPAQLCAVVDGLAYLVDVNAPDEPAMIAANAVVNVLPIRDVPLLLLASDTDLAGVGGDGAFWSAPRLVVDDLRVIRVSAEAIVCSGDVGGRMATITVSPESGVVWGSDYR